MMVQSNVSLDPGQLLSEQFFRRLSILEDICDYRLKWLTVYFPELLVLGDQND